MKEVTYITCPPTRAVRPRRGDVVRAERGLRVGRDQTTTGLCSAFTPLSFPCFDQILKLAVHA